MQEKKIRKFGVADHDDYWIERASRGRTREKRLHRFLVQLLEEVIPAGGNVLDCGVGDGHVTNLGREKFEMYGVELSHEALKMYHFPTDRIIVADLNDGIPEFGVAFDAVVASNVLHWLNSPPTFLRQVKNVLKPSGKLVVVIPNITNYHYRLGFLLGKFPPISPSHKNFQTPDEAEEMFRNEGYRIEKCLSPKKSFKAHLWPRVFGADIVYLLTPVEKKNS